ncbi:OsmC family protein [Elongatibacter sediminis]|uniref:OsmC family protein n=1 Tax=Elongatibacter sediminis TaxID=3119006 RepID=A0AAW9R5F9_9GAMM
MSEHTATVTWNRQADEAFVDSTYSRAHTWDFDGGARIAASSSPHVVPEPHSVAANVDPEEAFIAALSSCHMLFFLALAARRGYVIDAYEDHATGQMGRDDNGREAITRVCLRPRVTFSGERQPSTAELERLHHHAHEQCFIANSVKTEVVTELPQ